MSQSSESVTCSAKCEAAKHVVWGFLSKNVRTDTKACANTRDIFFLLVEALQSHGFYNMIQKLIQMMENK